ncbi:hypothetical protein MAR_018794, partial [Mya arenaria]
MSTKKVKIVALRLPNKNEPGVHNFSIEIVPKNKAKSVIKKRQKEKYEKDECIIPPTSPKIELPLDKDKKCEIKLRIEGGLKPADDMHDGEDIIVNIVGVPCPTETSPPEPEALSIIGGATA